MAAAPRKPAAGGGGGMKLGAGKLGAAKLQEEDFSEW
jgi:hypothetical protein